MGRIRIIIFNYGEIRILLKNRHVNSLNVNCDYENLSESYLLLLIE